MRHVSILKLPGVLVSAWMLTGVCAAAPAVTQAPESFDLVMKRGREALKAGRVAEAETLFEQACPADLVSTFAPAKAGACHQHLGSAALQGNHPETAPAIFRKAADAWLAAGPAFSETWGYTMLILGDLYQQQQQQPKAEEALTAYIRYLRSKGRVQTDEYARAMSRLAVTYADTGRPELGKDTVEAALEVFANLPKADAMEVAHARNTLGLVSLSMGQQALAEENLRIARQISVAERGEMDLETAGYQTNLALALLTKGDIDTAETLLRQARYVVEKTPGVWGNQVGMISAELSAIAVRRKRFALAADEAKKALEILRNQAFPDQRSIALAQVSIADVHLSTGRLREAEQVLGEAIPAERRYAPESRLLADGLRRLAQLRTMQKRYPEAQALYKEAIGLYERRIGVQNPAIVPLLREYAETLRRDGKPKGEIRDVEARMKSIGIGISGFAPRR
jgi:tetratricopeptide (TPR) repeat protein